MIQVQLLRVLQLIALEVKHFTSEKHLKEFANRIQLVQWFPNLS